MSPLRVALLTYRGKPHCGGQGIYTRHLSKALADLGHHVEVFSGQPYPVLDERVALHKLPSLDMWEHYPWFVGAVAGIRDRIDLGEHGVVLDERVALHKLPSLDMWEHYPWFVGAVAGIRDRIDLGEFARTALTGTFAEPWGFSKRAERALLA